MQTDPIVLEVKLPVTACAAWDAWNSPEALRLWLAEDARVGAAISENFELFWGADPSVNSTIGCRITDKVRPTQGAPSLSRHDQPTTSSVDRR